MVCAIEEEALEAIERLRQGCERDLLIDQNFNIPIFNILWRIATNRRYSVSVMWQNVIYLRFMDVSI